MKNSLLECALVIYKSEIFAVASANPWSIYSLKILRVLFSML
jgi:hypothetical protein